MQNKKEHARGSDRDHVALPYNCHNVRIIAASQFNPHEQETPMSKSYSLPTEPEGVIPSLIERFNSDKVSAMGPCTKELCSSRTTGEPSLIAQRSLPN